MIGAVSDDAAQEVCSLFTGIEPIDDLAAEHKMTALRWLAGTQDIYRRVKPSTPSPHLVSYFLLGGSRLRPSVAVRPPFIGVVAAHRRARRTR